MRRRLTNEEKETILQLHKEGWSYRKIGREIGRGHNIVSCVCDLQARERKRVKSREYYAEDPERWRRQRQKYVASHKELCKEADREYYNTHKEEKKEHNREYCKTLAGRVAHTNKRNRRRTLIKDDSGINIADFEKLWKEQDGKCFFCDGQMIRHEDVESSLLQQIAKRDERYCNREHLIPVSRGGKDEPSNIVLACRLCNSRKGNKTPEEFAAYKEKTCLNQLAIAAV